jgi:hypothetical protein
MGLVGNALGLAGFSWGNIASKLAKPFLGEAGAEMLGIAIDLKRGNIGGVIHNSMDLMEALSGKKAGCAGAHSCDRPSGIIGGILKAGFTAAAVLGGGALVGSLLGGTAMGGLAKMMLGAMGLMAAFKGGSALLGAGGGLLAGTGVGNFLGGLLPGGPFQGETNARNKLGMTYTNGGPGSLVNRLPANATFEDLVAAFMFDIVKDMQDEAKAKMDEIRQSVDKGDGKSASSGIGGFFGGLASKLPIVGKFFGSAQNSGKGEDSRNLMFEELKNIMQKLAQMQQAMSNVLNTMHEQAMSSIRHIKA